MLLKPFHSAQDRFKASLAQEIDVKFLMVIYGQVHFPMALAHAL